MLTRYASTYINQYARVLIPLLATVKYCNGKAISDLTADYYALDIEMKSIKQ